MADRVCVLGLRFGDQNISLLGKASLSITDSIYSLYNIAKLIIKDDKSIFKESGFFFAGQVITLDFGWPTKGMTNSCEYVVVDVKADFTISGASTTTYYLTNSMYIKQRLKSRAFKNKKVSDIIKEILIENGLKSDRMIFDIETTDTNTWYQGNITDGKFIQDFLMPNAYSKDTGATPIYGYFTSDGIYRFRSLKDMLDGKGLATQIKNMFISPSVASQSEMTTIPEDNSKLVINPEPAELIITNVQKMKVNMSDYYADLMKNTYVYQWSGGADSNKKTFINKIDSSLYVFNGRLAETNSKPLWFKVDPATRTTERTGWDMQFQVPYNDSDLIHEDYINKAQITQRMSTKMFPECYMFTSRLFPHIHAGDLVLVQFNDKAMADGYVKSISDYYVVLSSEHVYNADTPGSPALSKFVVGRPFMIHAPLFGDKHLLYRYPFSETHTVNDINTYFN